MTLFLEMGQQGIDDGEIFGVATDDFVGHEVDAFVDQRRRVVCDFE